MVPTKPIEVTRWNGAIFLTVFSAVEVARHPKIVVSDSELLAQITRDLHSPKYIRVHFVWIMGADNLYSIHHWDRWTKNFQAAPIAVVANRYHDRAAFFLCFLAV